MAYLYRHIRLDKNEPFYIGIGSDSNYNRDLQNGIYYQSCKEAAFTYGYKHSTYMGLIKIKRL